MAANQNEEAEADATMSTSNPEQPMRRSRRGVTSSDAKNTRISRLKRSSTLDGDTNAMARWRDTRLKAKQKEGGEGGAEAGDDPATEDDVFKTKGRPALGRSLTS